MRENIVALALKAYDALLPISWIVLAIVVLILLPMSLFKGTRGPAGFGMILASHLFGLTTWLLGAAITFGAFGWLGLILGLFIFGIGVVPLSIVGSILKLHHGLLAFWLVGMTIATVATRYSGQFFVRKSLDP